MTAPIQEPSVYRTQSGHTWGISQLARRPSPAAGACPCPIDWMYATMGLGQTFTDNVEASVTFESYGIAPGSTAFAANIATTPIQCTALGFYTFYLQSEWADAAFTDVRMHRIRASGAGDWELIDVTTYTPRDSKSDPLYTGLTTSLGPIHISDTPLNLAIREWQNNGGGSESLVSCLFIAYYLGPGLGIDDGVNSMSTYEQSF